MTKSISFWAVALCVALLSACGGGGEGDGQTPLPASVAEVKMAFDAAPQVLQSYGYELQTQGRSSNPDTVMERSGNLNNPRLVITYKGKVIYDETRGWGIYDAHGFAADGTYLILLIEHSAGSYEGVPVLFINGKRTDLPFGMRGVLRDIRNYPDGWLILYSTEGSIRSARITSWFSVYNLRTTEFVSYGEYVSGP